MKKDQNNGKHDEGFTLVELLVVLAIIGLLVGIGTPQVLRYLASAKVDAAKTQISSFESALELYYIDNGTYPTSEQGLSALISKPSDGSSWNGPYIKIKGDITDPWGNAYLYSNNTSGIIEIVSLGSDGARGGQDAGMDITN